jgi:predicted DNA-binding ribbon-helix-helix protein
MADRPDTAIVKRSVVISGHATSVSIEAAFWDGLKAMARERGVSLNALVAHIDAERATANLSSAIRLAVLAHYRDGTGSREVAGA